MDGDRDQRPGDVAQLGERRLCKPEVVGSNPIVSNEKFYGYFDFVVAMLESDTIIVVFYSRE
jgi:hypothetical protein